MSIPLPPCQAHLSPQDFAGIYVIPDYAYTQCETLQTVSFPDDILSIGTHAFSNCPALSSIQLPKYVEYIGPHAFDGTNMTFIEIPSSLTEINRVSFGNNFELETIKFNEGLVTIHDSGFASAKKLRNFELPKSLRFIEKTAFGNNPTLEYVNIPAGVNHIGEAAFRLCTSLSYVSLPNITSIGFYAFDQTQLGCVIGSDAVVEMVRSASAGNAPGATNDCSPMPTSPPHEQEPPFECLHLQSDGTACISSDLCQTPIVPYTMLPPPTECGQHYSKNTHEVEILNSQIHYDFNSRRLYGKIEIAQHTSSEEKLFLTAKVFNSRTKDRLQKFRLGKGEFPLYWMNIGPECASTMVLKFDGVIPSEYNFDNADSLRVKIKRGKKDSVACGNFYRVPLFNHDHHH